MTIKPMLVAPAVPFEGKIKFVLPDRDIILDEEYCATAWSILAMCNGVNTVENITDALEHDPATTAGFISDLDSLGVIADSQKLYLRFHEVSSNPSLFSTELSAADIVAHTRSPRARPKTGSVTGLPPAKADSQLVSLQTARKSCRSFSKELVSLREIGGLLDIGYSYPRHAVPSAGNLYPMKLFVIALEDQLDFRAGYYEYDNEANNLICFNEAPDPERTAYMLNSTGMPFGAPVVILVAADSSRQAKKYSNRAYRFMAIEAGHIGQNISLGAVELELATCELGGFLDGAVSDELDLRDSLPLLAIAVGKKGAPRVTQDLGYVLETTIVGPDRPAESFWSADSRLADNFDKSYFQVLAKTPSGQITSGISTSSSDATLKAIAEAYERHRSSIVRVDNTLPASKLDGEWLDPRIATPLTDEQYCMMPHLQKFHENLKIEWVRGKSWSGRDFFVPIDLVFYPLHELGRKKVVDTCSSGFAAYSTQEGAILRGLLELIERDALMRNWYERRTPPRVAFDFLPLHLQKRLRYWRDRGREVHVLDISQLGVIAVQVIIVTDDYPCFVSGASSSLGDFDDAAIKAFHEAESRLIHGLNEPLGRSITPNEVSLVLDHEALYAQSRDYHEHIAFLLEGDETDRPVASTTAATLLTSLDPIVVDASDVAGPLHVVKVLSPDLIPIGFGYGAEHHTHHSLQNIQQAVPIPHYFA